LILLAVLNYMAQKSGSSHSTKKRQKRPIFEGFMEFLWDDCERFTEVLTTRRVGAVKLAASIPRCAGAANGID
jgi:hypothetical protein